jgi:ankyrin repeat protein
MNEIILKEDFKLLTSHLAKHPDEAYYFYHNEKKYYTLHHILRHRKNQVFIKKAAHYLMDNFNNTPLNEKDMSGNSALILAMPLKDEELIDKMIKNGADIFCKTALGLNILFLAIQNHYSKDFILHLLERKIDIQDTDIFNHTIFTKFSKSLQYQELLNAITHFKTIEKEKTDLDNLLIKPVFENSIIHTEEKKRKKI